MTDTPTPIHELARRAKAATSALAVASTAEKDAALEAAADFLEANAEPIMEANAVDVASAEASGMEAPLVDRLRLDTGRIASMAGGLRQVAALRDPVGEITEGWVRPNGLRIEKTRVPLGVVAIIYESRPNVTSDAFGLCLKSGNVAFLRGSSSAINSNLAIAGVLRDALPKAGLPADALVMVDDTRREAATEFMQQRGFVDCLIPRGGPSLIQSILENATVPYVIDGAGNCHIYVDAAADLDMAREITHNAKTRLDAMSAGDTVEERLVRATDGIRWKSEDLFKLQAGMAVCKRMLKVFAGAKEGTGAFAFIPACQRLPVLVVPQYYRPCALP